MVDTVGNLCIEINREQTLQNSQDFGLNPFKKCTS